MNSITLCITMGRRPQLLEQSLSSLLKHTQFDSIVGINDFRDDETNQVFKKMCPNGHLISLEEQLGHHGAVDHMYGLVKTPWVFHCEDDWLFKKSIDMEKMIEILKQERSMSAISFREISDFNLKPEEEMKVVYRHIDDFEFFRLDGLHDQWHGYTFNPHLASIDIWQKMAPFSKYKKERHISRAIRKTGQVVHYLVEGGCSHLGADSSISNPPTSKQSIWKHWLGL